MELCGNRVTLVPVAPQHDAALRRIAAAPEVELWWGSEYLDPAWPLDDPQAVVFTILVDGVVAGLLQYSEEETPMFRHAGMDIFIDPALHNQGIGRDALRTLAAYLIDVRGHHRITIDPAAANEKAIRSYASIGFKPVGVMRQYENIQLDGVWKDGLMMDLLADELIR